MNFVDAIKLSYGLVFCVLVFLCFLSIDGAFNLIPLEFAVIFVLCVGVGFLALSVYYLIQRLRFSF